MNNTDYSVLELSTCISDDCTAFLLSIDSHYRDTEPITIIYGEIDHVYV
jgi:hypothetical protein